MPLTTRSGKKVENKPEYSGRYAHRNSTLPGQRQKKKKGQVNVLTRHQQTLQIAPPVYEAPKTPTDDQKEIPRLRRNNNISDTPYCSIYGVSRNALFPSFFFCTACCYFDEDKKDPLIKNKISRSSFRYKCTARHRSWVCPTETKQQYFMRNKISTCKQYASVKCLRNKNKRKKIIYSSSDEEVKNNEKEEEDKEESSTNSSECDAVEDKINELEKFVEILQKYNKGMQEEMIEMKLNLLSYESSNDMLTKENETLCLEVIEIVRSKKEIAASNKKLFHTMEELKKRNAEQIHRIDKVEKELLLRNRKLKYQLVQNASLLSTIKEHSTTITHCTTAKNIINNFVLNLKQLGKEKNRNLSKLSKMVTNSLWNESLLDGCLVEQLILQCKKHFRDTIFSPQNLLRTMDMYGGQLSMNAIDIMRQIEVQGEKSKHGSMIPSSGSIKKVCKIVDEYAKSVVPFTEGRTMDGYEFAEFCPIDVVTLIMNAYQLNDVAKKRSITISQAIDGSQLSSRTHHCTYGLKVADKAAIDPNSGNYIFASNEATTLQSRNNCFPLKVVFHRETKQVMEEFRAIMLKVKELTDFNTAKKYLKSHPIKCAMDCDLSATWKLLAKGGATKIKNNPCHLCAITDNNLVEPNAVPCERWCMRRHESSNKNILCYHQDFVDPSSLEDLRVKLNNYKEEINVLIPDLKKMSLQCKINCDEDPRAILAKNQQQDTSSIHFDFRENSVDDLTREVFGDSVTHDLMLRKLSGSGSLVARVQRLKNRLVQEYMYKKIHNNIQYVEQGQDKAFLLMHECVPCILHLENRTGLKLLTLILQAGITNVLEENSYVNINGMNNKMKIFVHDVEEILNKKIFGSVMRPSNFHLPFNFKEKKFEDITMDNNRTRQVMASCSDIVGLCIVDATRHNQWLEIIQRYNIFMKVLRYKEDFSDNLISDFQFMVDDFYHLYIEVNGRAGITNYFHMLGSGHISDFLFYYRNLYVHSQQGWEAFNSYLKVFFFRRSSRGGGRGDNNRVRQIARWLSRRLIWMAGKNYIEMRNYSLRKNEEKNRQQGNEILHEKQVNDHDESFVEDFSEDNNSLDSLLDDDSINYY